MFGDAILVAPKLQESELTPAYEIVDKVLVYLPQSADWYYYFTKHLEPKEDSLIKTKVIPEDEQGIFVKAGSILPIKLHSG